MRIAFRVDASQAIGTGHLMRCLTLALQLREEGHEVFFICRDHIGFPENLLIQQQIKLFKLVRGKEAKAEDCYADWLGVSWDQDKNETIAILKQQEFVDWLVVDHYALDASWEFSMRNYANKILVIDDLANRAHDADILVDQNYYIAQDRYQNLVPKNCLQLLGPAYALLRREFANLHSQAKIRRHVKRILVNFGGVDPDNCTLVALQGLLLMNVGDVIDVVVGQSNPHQVIIKAFCEQSSRFNYYCQTPKMAELMLQADLAIGAGGSTSWERCCLALPAIILSIAENQEQLAKDLAAYGAIRYLGNAKEMTAEQIADAVTTRLEIPRMSQSGYNLVDGQGVNRVTEQMNAYRG